MISFFTPIVRMSYSTFPLWEVFKDRGEVKHLKIETRLINERFTSVMGEYVFLK